MLDRETGKVHTRHVAKRKKGNLQEVIREVVTPGSEVNTDAPMSYEGLNEYTHKVVDHAERYFDGTVHTNRLENYWSLLKRTIKGTYVSIEPFHLFRYIDEQSFRYNERKLDDKSRFLEILSMIVGKRLKWSILMAQEEG